MSHPPNGDPPRSARGPKSRRARSRQAPPDPGAFLNPWDFGSLIRYLAWMRQAYGALPLPRPRGPQPSSHGAPTGPGVPLLELFVQPRLARQPRAARSLDLFDLLDRRRQVVILGGPGSGRSTLLAWLVHGLTDPGRNPVIDRLGRMVPVVVPIRALSMDDSTRTFPALLERLAELPFWYDGMDEVLPDLAARGQVLFVVDDLDFPLDPGVQEALREAVLDGIWRHGRCTWLLTAEARTYAAVPLVVEGVDTARVPRELQPLVDGQLLRVPDWHLQPFSPEQIRGYAHRWLALAHSDPGQVDESVDRFCDAVKAAPRAVEVAETPGLLALLGVVFTARGDIPPDRATLLDWLVAAWMATLDGAPGSELVPPPARRSWVEALARAAESARVAATRRRRAWRRHQSGPPPPLTETPTLGYRRCANLLRRVLRNSDAPDPGESGSLRFVQSVSVRPGILVGRGNGLAFVRADHQRFLAALHLAADLGTQEAGSTTAEAALSTLRSWSKLPTAQDDLVELFGILGSSPELIRRVSGRILDAGPDRSVDELAELGPLALALQEGEAEVSEPLRNAASELVDEAVERWAAERGRVPPWTRDLSPIARHPELERLDLHGCAAVTDLTPLSGLSKLRRIELRGCARIQDLSPIERLQKLQWADLRDCTSVSEIGPLGRLANLRWLDLGGCESLTDLSALSGLTELQALVLHGCTGITDLAPVGSIRNLRALVISGCTGITDLRPLRVLPAGGTVWVRGSGVRRVPPDLRWKVVGLDRF